MKIIDLYCGLGGWARGLIDAGHEVTGYDIMDFSQEYPGEFIQADLMAFSGFTEADVVVASPPCTEFSKASMPKTWACNRKEPDIATALALFHRAEEIIQTVEPQWWVIENVRGAVKFVGEAKEHFGSRYLWGKFPQFQVDGGDLYGKWRLPPSPSRGALRSVIPYSIARGLGDALMEMEEVQ